MAERADNEQAREDETGSRFRGVLSSSPAFAGFHRAVVASLPKVEPVDTETLLGHRPNAAQQMRESIEALPVQPRPDPDLLRELIARTSEGNAQNTRIIEQNDQLLEGAKRGGRWTVASFVVAAIAAVAAIVAVFVPLWLAG